MELLADPLLRHLLLQFTHHTGLQTVAAAQAIWRGYTEGLHGQVFRLTAPAQVSANSRIHYRTRGPVSRL